MASGSMVVAALGRPFTLGMLYSAQRDQLIPGKMCFKILTYFFHLTTSTTFIFYFFSFSQDYISHCIKGPFGSLWVSFDQREIKFYIQSPKLREPQCLWNLVEHLDVYCNHTLCEYNFKIYKIVAEDHKWKMSFCSKCFREHCFN